MSLSKKIFCIYIKIFVTLQVRLILLPTKKQKHKTKIRSGENPQYIESFVFHRVNPG